MINWTFNHLSGFFPRSSSAAAVSLPPKPATDTPQPVTEPVQEPNPHLAWRRSQALRTLYPKLSSWFGSRRDALLIGEINEYLSQASNITDLEQRIRVIEKQRHFS